MNRFNKEEYYDLVDDLSVYHEIFSAIFKLCRPRFSDEIPTAAVYFDPAGGCIDFAINEKFWNEQDEYSKKFILCHEMTHVVNMHGMRTIPFRDKYTPEVLNIALDLAVNHMLTNNFGFNRFKVKGWENLCWCDTAFTDLDLDPNKSFEYYITKVKENLHKIKVNLVISDHKGLDTFNANANSSLQRNLNEILGKLDEKGQKDQGKSLKDMLDKFNGGGAGLDEGASFSIYTGQSVEVKKIQRWESILTKYIFRTEKEKESLQWIRAHRRLGLLSSDLILPSENETVERDFNKYNVWLFLDYSGSCSHLKNIFFKASATFDPRKFILRKFAHTTKCAEFEGQDCKIYGGGTDFRCIENIIQEYKRKGKINQYPDCIMHFTDGESYYPFTVEKPDRWYVFLTNGGQRNIYQAGTNFFNLRDFVEDYSERW